MGGGTSSRLGKSSVSILLLKSSSWLLERDQSFGDTSGLDNRFSVDVLRDEEPKESGVAERDRPLDPPLL